MKIKNLLACSYVMSKNSSRLYLCGVQIKGISMTATDGCSLVIITDVTENAA